MARDYAARRAAFGRPIAGLPLHAATLADMEAEAAAVLALVMECAALLGRSEAGTATEAQRRRLRALIPLAKLTTAKQAVACASEALECFGGALAGWGLGGAPTDWNIPAPGTFSVNGGSSLTPEFLSVLLGLVLYTASYIAEVVRAGIASVPLGQTEAASAIGLSKGQQMRLVALPQALRVIIPPLTNQFLNLTKNSSLAVAISNTALNQTGRAIECITIIMAVYLITSLGTSALMNWYNQRAAIKER